MKNFVEINRASTGAKKTFNFKSFFSSIGQKTHCITAAENEKKTKTTRKRLENDSKTIGYITGTWRESGARVAKYAAMLIAVLILSIGQMWGTVDFTPAQIYNSGSGTTTSGISVSSTFSVSSGSSNGKKLCTSMTKEDAISMSSSAGGTYSDKYIEIAVPANCKITAVDVLTRSNGDSKVVGAAIYWTGAASTTIGSSEAIDAPARNSSDCTTPTSLTVPSNTRTIRLYRGPKIKNGEFSGSGTAVGGTSTFNIFGLSVTATGTVTHSLTNVTRSSGATTATLGSAYSATYAASSGYALPSTISVTIGGNDSTSACTWNNSTGALSIPARSVTGAIVVTITGESAAPACSAPAAPTISGTTSYTYGGTITLTANCASGADASTTYTWYKGDTWGSKSQVQAAATGSSGYTFTKTAALSDAGTYWCEASNGTGCEAHNSTGKTITVSKADMPSTGLATGTATSITANGATLPFTMTSTSGVGSLTIKVYKNSDDELVKTVSNISPATSGSQAVTGLSASTTYYYTITPIGDANHNDGSPTSKSSTFTTLSAGYTLTYDANGGSGSMDNTSGSGSITLSTNTYTKSGCSFAGWATSQANANAGTITYDDGDSYTLSADATLYAVWKVNTPTISSSEITPGTPETTTTEFTVPSGATLYYTTDGTDPTSSSTAYNAENGIEVSGSATTIKIRAIRANHIQSDVLTVPFYQLKLNCTTGTCTPVAPYVAQGYAYEIYSTGNNGYSFDGWSTTSGSGSFGDASSNLTTYTMTSTGATIYATWSCAEPVFGTNLSTSQVDYSVGAAASALTVAATAANSGTVTYQWYSNDENNYDTPTTLTNCTTATYTPLTASEGTTYYFCVATNTSGGNCTTNSNIAKIVVSTVSYTLTYDLGGASGAQSGGSAAGSYAEGATITVPAKGTLAKSGYTFRGWHDGTTFYLAGQTFTMNSDVTLTAVWDGGSGSSTATYNFNSGNASGLTIAKTNASWTYTVTNSTYNNIPILDSYFLGMSFLSSSTGELTITTDASYSNIDSIKFNSASTDNSNPKVAIMGVKQNGNDSTTLLAAIVVSSGSTKKWRATPYSLDLHSLSPQYSGKVRFKFTTGSSGKYGGIDNITIYYHTAATNFTVSFADGNTAPASHLTWPDDIAGVPSGKKILEPSTTPTGSGYIFGGWYTSANCTTAVDFSTMTITADKTIYAKWTAKTQPTQYTLSGDTYYCPSGTATLTLSGSQSGISYQLLKGGSASGDPKAGTGSELEWEVDAAGTYTVKAVENATYSERAMSGSVTVSAAATTAISSGPTTSVSAATGVNFTLGSDMVTAGHGLEYQWYSYTSSGGAGEAAVDGAESATYTTSKSAGTYYYKVKVSGDCGDPVYSNMITVTVKNTPTVYTVSGTTSICSGETATITLADSEDGIEYQLLKGGVAEGDPVDGTGDALEWEVSAAGTYTVKTVETSTYAEATMSSSAVITVNAVTAFTTNLPTSTKYINANASYTYTIAASGTSLSYQWYTCNSDGTGKVAMSNKTTASMTYTFTNSDAPTKYVCCVVTGTCGTITSNVQPVNITPTYYLTINLNGGSGGGISSGNRPAGNFIIANSSTIPTKSGYVFLGWKFSTNNVIYQPGATVTMPSAAATLTAQWASEEFKFSKGTKGTEPTDGFVITPDNINSSAFTAGATLTGGTMTNTSGATLGINASYGFVMIKNTRSISVALSSGAFQAGTVIYLEGYTNKNSTAYTYGFSVSGNAAGSPVSETTNAYVAFKQRYVVTAGDGIAGTSSFTLTFNSSATGAQAYLSLIAIGNCLSCTTISPTLTYSATTLYAFGGTPNTATPTLNKDGNTGAVTWTSSNTDAVTVDASGNITAVGAGSATITAELPYDGTHCGGTASCDITVPALVTQTLNVASETAWGTTPALTFTPSDKGMEQVLRLTKNTFTFDSTSTSTKQDGTSKRWMTASFTGSETTKGKYLKMAFKNTQHNLRLGEVVVPIQPISNNGSAQVEIYEGSTLRMTSTAVTGITKGSLADVHFTFASPYVFAAGSTINVYIYFYGQTTGFRLASPILISGAVLTDYTYTTSGNWSTAANWNWGKLPMAGDNVVLEKPVTVDNTSAVAKNVVIDKSGGNTGKLTIAADGMLIAGGTIRANGDAQTAVEDVVINCSKTSQGALIFDNPAGSKQTKGTVNFYTRSYRDGTSKKLQWQYVGVPFDDVTDEVYGGLYVNKYSETAGSWTVMRYQGDRSISAWDGLAISGDEEGYASMQGTFTSTDDKNITLTHSAAAGENLIGNSWTAPIQIAGLEESDFGDATATIYLFNTGRYKESEGSGSSTESGTKEHTAGQWMTIPISSAASGVWAGMKVIPAFNAFEVITSSEATLSLGYSKVVASATNDVNAEMRAPVRRTSAKDIDGYRIRVADELTYTDMYLFEDITFTTGHDNGWDGDYMPCDGRSAQLYAQTALGKMAVAALPDLEGTVLGFKPGQSTEYTFSFGTNAGGYYLNDLKMQESTLIQEGNTYTFNWEDGDSTNRFIISATPYKMPTGVDEVQGDKVQSDKVRKVLIDDHLYIIHAGEIFDATGGRVR